MARRRSIPLVISGLLNYATCQRDEELSGGEERMRRGRRIGTKKKKNTQTLMACVRSRSERVVGGVVIPAAQFWPRLLALRGCAPVSAAGRGSSVDATQSPDRARNGRIALVFRRDPSVVARAAANLGGWGAGWSRRLGRVGAASSVRQ